MNRTFLSLVVASMTVALFSSAQDAPADKSAAPDDGSAPASDAQGGTPKPKLKKGMSKPGEAEPAPPPAQNALPPVTGGDTLHMVSGTTMTGVQVIKSTPKFYEVQLIEGQPPIQIPRRQVTSVDYDDVDPGREKLRKVMFPEEQEVTIASGERVTGALRDKLMAPVSAEPMSFKDQDLIKVLDDIRTKTAVKLVVDPSIEQKPVAQRKWSVEVPPDKTLMALLREDLVGAVKYAEVVFESDTIYVMTKEAAKARAAANPASADPAAAPAEGAAAPAEKTPATAQPKAPAQTPAAGKLPGQKKP